MIRAILTGALALLGPQIASAEPLMLELPGPSTRNTVSYECSDGTARSAEYVNLPGNSLALLTVGKTPLVFVNVIAASGARYASGAYVWWTKGREATLTDTTKGETPLATCTEKAN